MQRVAGTWPAGTRTPGPACTLLILLAELLPLLPQRSDLRARSTDFTLRGDAALPGRLAGSPSAEPGRSARPGRGARAGVVLQTCGCPGCGLARGALSRGSNGVAVTFPPWMSSQTHVCLQNKGGEQCTREARCPGGERVRSRTRCRPATPQPGDEGRPSAHTPARCHRPPAWSSRHPRSHPCTQPWSSRALFSPQTAGFRRRQ